MAPLDWVSTAATALQEAGPSLAQRTGFWGVSIADLLPGDHVYAWKMGYTYNHHGIVVHTASCEADGAQDQLECCSIVHFRPPENTRPGQIEICSLSDFAQGREIFKCRYAVPQAEFYLARAGTCSTHVADAVPLRVLRALSLLEVSQQTGGDAAAEVEYDLLQKNSELLARWCLLGSVSGVQRFCSSERAFSPQTSPGRFVRLGLAAAAVAAGAAGVSGAVASAASAGSAGAAASEAAVTAAGAATTIAKVAELAALGSTATCQAMKAGSLAASEASRHLLMDMLRRPAQVQNVFSQISEAVQSTTGGYATPQHTRTVDSTVRNDLVERQNACIVMALRTCLQDMGVATPKPLSVLLDSPAGCCRLAEMLVDVLEEGLPSDIPECRVFVQSFLDELVG